MYVDLNANEVVRKAGNADFFHESGEVKGKLILTNQRIYFKAADAVSRINEISIIPAEIEELLYFKTRKIFPNGLSIVLKDGKEIRFRVKKRDSWSELINRII